MAHMQPLNFLFMRFTWHWQHFKIYCSVKKYTHTTHSKRIHIHSVMYDVCILTFICIFFSHFLTMDLYVYIMKKQWVKKSYNTEYLSYFLDLVIFTLEFLVGSSFSTKIIGNLKKWNTFYPGTNFRRAYFFSTWFSPWFHCLQPLPSLPFLSKLFPRVINFKFFLMFSALLCLSNILLRHFSNIDKQNYFFWDTEKKKTFEKLLLFKFTFIPIFLRKYILLFLDLFSFSFSFPYPHSSSPKYFLLSVKNPFFLATRGTSLTQVPYYEVSAMKHKEL